MTYANQVVIGPEFFKKAFNDYTNWRWAIIREFLQNSIDAGSKKIDITIHKHQTTTTKSDTVLKVRNDGAPMTREVLVNKLLSLGGSGKNFQNSVGGFGKAKEILYYAHQSYRIDTGDVTVHGSGAGYDLSDRPYFRGTESEVLISGDYVDSLVTNVKTFASTAQWDGVITCNGEEYTSKLKKGSPRRELDFGTVYTNKSFTNRLIVRISGIPMFVSHIDYPDTVIVELNGSSVEVLASNRDVLRYPYSNQLEEFIAEIAINKRSAIKKRDRSLYTHYAGDKLTGKSAGFNLVHAISPKASTASPSVSDDSEASEPLISGDDMPSTPGVRPNTAAFVKHADAITSCLSQDFVVKNNTFYEIPAYYLPDSGEFSTYAMKLVKIWTRLMVQLHTTFKVKSSFAVGFVFDSSVEAERESHSDYGTIYYINPVKLVGSSWAKAFKLTDRGRLLMTAVHEFTHHDHWRHDEDFAAAMTDIAAQVYDNRKDFSWCFKD